MFPKVKQLLEMFATGEYTLTSIQREATKLGVLGRQNKKSLPLSSLGNLFRCQFYYGVFMHKGELHQGMHIPMISKKTFDEIQAALLKIGKPRNKRTDKGFLFLNFATCGTCGHSITGERHIKKGGHRYRYYRCTHKNKQPHADDRNLIREEQFAEEIKRNVALVTIPDEWKEKFLAQIELWQNEEAQARQRRMERVKSELTALKTKIDRLNTAFIEGGIEIQEFKELKNPLIVQKTVLEQKLVEVEKGKASPIELLKNFVLEANQAEKWISEENWSEMKAYLQKVRLNSFFRSQTLTVTFKKPWISLAETNLTARSARDFSNPNSRWWRRWELNPRPLQSLRKRLHACSTFKSRPRNCRWTGHHASQPPVKDSSAGLKTTPANYPAIVVSARQQVSQVRRRSQLSCESEFFVRCYVFARCLTRPPDNLGMPFTLTPQSRIRFAPQGKRSLHHQYSRAHLKSKARVAGRLPAQKDVKTY